MDGYYPNTLNVVNNAQIQAEPTIYSQENNQMNSINVFDSLYPNQYVTMNNCQDMQIPQQSSNCICYQQSYYNPSITNLPLFYCDGNFYTFYNNQYIPIVSSNYFVYQNNELQQTPNYSPEIYTSDNISVNQNKTGNTEEVKAKNRDYSKTGSDKKLNTQMFILSILLILGYKFTLRKDKTKKKNGEVYYVLTELQDPQGNIVFTYDQIEKEVMQIETVTNPIENANKMKKVRQVMKKLIVSHEMNLIIQLLNDKYNINIVIKRIEEGNKPNSYRIQYPIPKNAIFNSTEIESINYKDQEIIGKYFYDEIFANKIENGELSFSSFDIDSQYYQLKDEIKIVIVKLRKIKRKENEFF